MELDQDGLVNGKFLRLLARWWWIPVLTAIVFGVAAVGLARNNRYEGQLDALAVLSNSSLAGTEMSPDTLPAANPFASDVAVVDQQTVLAKLKSDIHGALGAEFFLNENKDVATVVVTATTRQGVADAFSFYESQLLDARRASYQTGADALIASIQQTQASLSARIAELRGEIAALPVDSPGEVPAALLTDIADREADLLEAQTNEASIRALVADNNEIIRFSPGEITSVGAGIVTTSAAVVLGAVLGLLGLLLFAWLDRRIRSEVDVRRALPGARVDVVGDLVTRRDVERAASILATRFSDRRETRVLLVPVDDSQQAADTAAAIANIAHEHSEQFFARRSLSDSAERLLGGDCVVLVSLNGKTSYASLRETYSNLQISQIPIDAVLITASSDGFGAS